MKRLITKKANDEKLQGLIQEWANELEERVDHYESNYSGDGDPWEDDSFYDTIADVHMEYDSSFISKATEILAPNAPADVTDDVEEKALDYLQNNTQGIDDRDYEKRYEILLAGVKQALNK